MITLDEMKDALVENEVDYIKEMVIKDRHDDLVEFVYLHSFDDFRHMDDGDIKELYNHYYGDMT